MTNTDRQLMFAQVKYDLHMADAYASEINRTSITPESASELLRRCVKANASCQAWERVMHGIEPPKRGWL